MKKDKHHLRNRGSRQPIHQTVRAVVLIFFVAFVVVAILGNQMLYNAFSADYAQQQGELYERYLGQIETYLAEAERLSLQLIASESIQHNLAVIGQAEGQSLANARTVLRSAIAFTAGDAANFTRNVILRDAKGFIYSYGSVLNKSELTRSTEELFDTTPTDGRLYWSGLVSSGREYMVLTRAVRQSQKLSLAVLGYEAVCVDVQTMLSDLDGADNTLLNTTEIYMDGLRLYHGKKCPKLDKSALDEIPDRKLVTVNGRKLFITKTTVFGGRIEFVSYANFDNVIQTLHISRIALLAVTLALSLLLMSAAMHILDSVLKRLDCLATAVEQLGPNDLRPQLCKDLLKSRDEVGLLARHIQRLMIQMDDLINLKLKKQLYAAQAQNKMLQAQIRPHFLYNTLETIHAIAVKSDNVQISRISLCLSKLVRASYRGGMYAPLREEIDFVQQYLTIYRIRFGGRLQAYIENNDADGDILLPRMTLQPLMENSVRYGLMQKLGRGIIHLRIDHRGDRLIISLFDNGVGFPPEVIEKYNHLSLADELEIHGYGNVLARLRFTYGEEARVQVRSREGAWTNLSIVIPDRLPESVMREEADDV